MLRFTLEAARVINRNRIETERDDSLNEDRRLIDRCEWCGFDSDVLISRAGEVICPTCSRGEYGRDIERE